MSWMNRISSFASSPQGRKLIDRAKEFASDPKRREQAKQAYEKFRQSRKPQG